MILEIADWVFDVDITATMADSAEKAHDHCTCGYCRNFYEALDGAYPELRAFLAQFGIDSEGVSELLPFEPTLYLVGYDVKGSILSAGKRAITVDGAVIEPENVDSACFRLTVGELMLPWILEEDMDEVVSPANDPECLSRMNEILLMRHGESLFLS